MQRTFVFHGVDSKTGTTMLTQSVAEWIAREYRQARVLFVSLNGRPGTEYTDSPEETMESLKIFLDNKLLSGKELMSGSKRGENLHVIGGISDFRQVRSFSPEAAEYFLENVEKDFDFVFVDAGNDLDNGLAIGALGRSKLRILVLTQQESMLARFEKLNPVYEKLEYAFSFTVVNKYRNDDPYDLSYISKRLSLPPEKLFPVTEALCARAAEAAHKTLLNFKEAKYKEDIGKLALQVLDRCGMEKPEGMKKKKWISFI